MIHKLEAVKLSKIIKKHQIIHDFSLEVNSGEVVGLLGPNGAGKTTTFYMICGLIASSSGNVYLNGKDISEIDLIITSISSPDLYSFDSSSNSDL